MALWMMALAAMTLSEQCKDPAPPEDAKVRMQQQRVEGYRYDYEVEVGERVDRYRDAARRVAEQIAASRQAFLDRLSAFVDSGSRARSARDVVRETGRRADALAAEPHALCAWLAGRRTGARLSPEGRALIAALEEATAPDGPPDRMAICMRAPLPDASRARAMCLRLLAPDEASCRKVGPADLCRILRDPNGRDVSPTTRRGDALLIAWFHARRTGRPLHDVAEGAPDWLTKMAGAIEAEDPDACPGSTDWRTGHLDSAGTDPDAPFADLSPIIASTYDGTHETLVMTWLSLFPALCHIHALGATDASASVTKTLGLDPAPEDPQRVEVPLPGAGEEPPRITCRIVARVDPAGDTRAR